MLSKCVLKLMTFQKKKQINNFNHNAGLVTKGLDFLAQL